MINETNQHLYVVKYGDGSYFDGGLVFTHRGTAAGETKTTASRSLGAAVTMVALAEDGQLIEVSTGRHVRLVPQNEVQLIRKVQTLQTKLLKANELASEIESWFGTIPAVQNLWEVATDFEQRLAANQEDLSALRTGVAA